MVQQYISQHDVFGNLIHLYYQDLQTTINRFNRDSVVSANWVSISLTGEAESYEYHAVLDYNGLKVRFLIYPDLSWGLGVEVVIMVTELTVQQRIDYWTRKIAIGSVWLTQEFNTAYVTVMRIEFDKRHNAILVSYTRQDTPGLIFQDEVKCFLEYTVSSRV